MKKWKKIRLENLCAQKEKRLENLKIFREEGKWEKLGDKGYERILRR